MKEEETIRQLREDIPRIPDPAALTQRVLDRISMEAQVRAPTHGTFDHLTDLLLSRRMRVAVASAATALLLLFTIQFVDVLQDLHSTELQCTVQQAAPGTSIQAMYTAERQSLPGLHAKAVDVLRDAGFDARAMNGYVAVRKADLRPFSRHFMPFAPRQLHRLKASGVSPTELPSLLDDLRSQVFLSIRFPV